MFHSKFLPIATIAALFSVAGNVGAQNLSASGSSAQKSSGSQAEPAMPMLRIQLVISRFEGEKKVASLPYTFTVSPLSQRNSGSAAIRMGVDAPIPMTSIPDADKGGTTVQYRSIGTDIDCNGVMELPDGRYQFQIGVRNTAAVPPSAGDGKNSLPLFRRFDASFTPVLRDGQSMQTIASTDPVTGEVIKIDVTLNVIR
ncbi:MAG: hypothetical protein ABIQ86_01475 [Steroidobacteraceae bacterium]